MQRTQNYNLCQWAAEDRILRSDFNADNQKIDTALKAASDAAAAAPRIAFGTYTGDGAYGSGNPKTLTFEFAPKFVVIAGWGNNVGDFILLTYNAYENHSSAGGAVYATWDNNTVSWYGGSHALQLNRTGSKYCYVAFG